MKTSITIKYFISLFLIVFSISCSQNPLTKEKPQIRFVDLQGNARKIKLNTPTENISALTKQGRISQAKLIEGNNYKQGEEKSKNLSYNKYSDDNQKGLVKASPPAKKNGLIYTMNLPTKKNDQETIQKPTSDKGSGQSKAQTKEKEYNLSKGKRRIGSGGPRIISETKIPASSSSQRSENNPTKLAKGRYVQVGSFTRMSHAKQHLGKVRNITNNLKNINIQSAKVRRKNYYRVVIGPITKKKTAKLLIKDLKRKGQNSIIIKIK